MPKLSIIRVGRNDCYGGNFMGRLVRAFSMNWRNQTFDDIERIFIEWKPPTDEFASYILAPLGWTCYVVDPAIHDELLIPEYPNVTFFIAHSKNVGIRRARGEWILLANADTIFSPEVWQLLAGELREDTLYRARRLDIDVSDVCKLFGMVGEVNVNHDHGRAAQGDFMLFPASKRSPYDESRRDVAVHLDSRWMKDHTMRYETRVEYVGDIYKIDHPRTWVRTRNTTFESDTGTTKNWRYKEKVNKGRGIYDSLPTWGLWDRVETQIADGITYISKERR
jgi:hypothetical protein